MIDPEHELPINKQTKILQISLSSVYYKPHPVPEADLWLMRRIDEFHLSYPFAGSRMLRESRARTPDLSLPVARHCHRHGRQGTLV